MKHTLKESFKRTAVCLAETCQFYKAAFTTQISRVRFNQMLKRRRAHDRHAQAWF